MGQMGNFSAQIDYEPLKRLEKCLRCLSMGREVSTKFGHLLCDTCYEKVETHDMILAMPGVQEIRRLLNDMEEDKVLLPARINGPKGDDNTGTIIGATQGYFVQDGPKKGRFEERNGKRVWKKGQTIFNTQREVSRGGRNSDVRQLLDTVQANTNPDFEPIPTKIIIASSQKSEISGGHVVMTRFSNMVPRYLVSKEMKEVHKAQQRALRRVVEQAWVQLNPSLKTQVEIAESSVHSKNVASSVRVPAAGSDSEGRTEAKVNCELVKGAIMSYPAWEGPFP